GGSISGPQGTAEARGVCKCGDRRTRAPPPARSDGNNDFMTALEHRFGSYGGQYVPETLMPALEELERAWLELRDDEGFRAQLDALLGEYVGRPSPLYHARRLSQAVGHPILLKREDLNHTG